jgi:tetratricopeptide (TPR) repeat protein
MAYMRGRVEASKGTAEGYGEAIQFFREAVEKDSSYAPAYTGLAGTQLLLQLAEPDSTVDLTAAAEAAATAVRLDAESPEAQAVLSGVNRLVFVMSDSLSRRLGTLNVGLDSMAVTSEEWATMFTEVGREAQRIALEREVAVHERARPENRVRGARYLASQGKYEEAEELLRQSLERDPTAVAAWDALEYLYAVRGDFVGAARVYGERVTHTSEAGGEESARRLEQAVARSGAAGYWEWQLARLGEREARGEAVSQVDYAAALVRLGRHDEAIEHLQRAVEQRDRRVYSLVADPVWDPIRGDPRFTALVDRLRRRPPTPPNAPGRN